MVFATKYEDLLPAIKEDAAVFIRAAVLPEEGGPPKLSIQEMVKLEDARVDLPSLISIRMWLKDEICSERVKALSELFVRRARHHRCPLASRKTARFLSRDGRAEHEVRPDREFCAELEKICGPEAMEVLAS